MLKKMVTLMNGTEEELKIGSEVIDANRASDIEMLLSNSEVKALSKSTASPYGKGVFKVYDSVLDVYYLKKGGKYLTKKCIRIVPIMQTNLCGEIGVQRGIVYCVSKDPKNGNYFMNYEIRNDKINTFKSNYCVMNRHDNIIIPIKNYSYINCKSKSAIRSDVKSYIKSLTTDFSMNDLIVGLLNSEIIDKSNVNFVLEVMDEMRRNGEISFYSDNDNNVFYSNVINKTKIR